MLLVATLTVTDICTTLQNHTIEWFFAQYEVLRTSTLQLITL